MKYVNEKEAGYWFPARKIAQYYKSLPATSLVDNQYYIPKEKIAIITVDDIYDEEIDQLTSEYGVAPPTYFLLMDKAKANIIRFTRMGLHFDKTYSLESQIEKYKELFVELPILNRTHRVWWRSDNIEFAYLAMNGIKVDSSKPGILPYRPCIEGRLLPIWEIPFSVYELSVEGDLHASYQVARSFKDLISREVSPIVGMFHPLSLQKKLKFKSVLEEFIVEAKKHGYTFMTMMAFYRNNLV